MSGDREAISEQSLLVHEGASYFEVYFSGRELEEDLIWSLEANCKPILLLRGKRGMRMREKKVTRKRKEKTRRERETIANNKIVTGGAKRMMTGRQAR